MRMKENPLNLPKRILQKIIGLLKSIVKNYHFVAVLLIAVGGFIHTTIIPIHVDSIVLLYSQSIGFHMFTVVLMSIVNVFNAANLNKNKSIFMLFAVYAVSSILVISTINYIGITINELSTIDTVELTSNMYYSVTWMYVVMGTTIAGVLLATVSFVATRRVKS